MPKSTPATSRQPNLSSLVTVINSPGSALSDPAGNLGVTAIEGYYLDDRRLLSHTQLLVADQHPEHVATAFTNPATAEFTLVVRGFATSDADFGLDGDSQLSALRTRTINAGAMIEQIEIRSASLDPITTTVSLRLGSDGATVSEARSGMTRPLISPGIANNEVVWHLEDADARASFDPAPDSLESPPEGFATARWTITVPPGGTVSLSTRVTASGELAQPTCASPPARVLLDAAAPVRQLFDRSLADVYALVRTDPHHPGDRYVCAGAPWYLTLFGRDSLWAARMLLPIDPWLALGTLRTLAREQGTRHDAATAEQPGKIPHELRRERAAQLLPARYYGSADATSLWIILLVETWRWGTGVSAIRELLPALKAALGWLHDYADSDGDGFIDYRSDPAGLANQGWKDSRDAVHDFAGAEHSGTVALAEVQAYAYQAAMGAADLLDALGEDGERWRDWGDRLRSRFHDEFWTGTGPESYPALAVIDRVHRADAITSNMGHLLETGIVDDDEAARIASRLAGDDMNSGFGLRTLSTQSPRYNPISYHNGSVWPHDTAIAIRGLAVTGAGDAARLLAHGIVAAGEHFEARLPELWSGSATAGSPQGTQVRPVPYPTACSPQGWSAASIVTILIAALGIEADLPNGRLMIRPPRQSILGSFTVRGIALPTGTLDVHIDECGDAHVLRAPEGVMIDVVNS